MVSKTSTPDNLMSLREVARILQVHKETLRRWDNEGKLKAIRVGDRQDRKYKAEDLIPLLKKKK